MKIGFNGERIPQQALATVFGDQARKNSSELDPQQAQLLSERGILEGKFGTQGEFLILKWRGKAFALGKQGEQAVKVRF